MNRVASILISLPVLNAEPPTANGGWDLTSAATLIAIILIIGFAVVAGGWAIGRDV